MTKNNFLKEEKLQQMATKTKNKNQKINFPNRKILLIEIHLQHIQTLTLIECDNYALFVICKISIQQMRLQLGPQLIQYHR